MEEDTVVPDDRRAAIEELPVRAFELLSQLRSMTSSLVALSAIGLGIGWIRCFAYFSGLNASWVLPELSLSVIGVNAALPLYALGAALILTFLHASDPHLRGGNLRKLDFGFAIAGTILTPVALIALWIEDGFAAPLLSALALVCWSASFGLAMFGMLSASPISEIHRPWAVRYIIFAALPLVVSPWQLGKIQALSDIDSNGGGLPRVSLDNDSTGWRLLTFTDQSLVLVEIADKKVLRFRVVNAADAREIRPSSTPAASQGQLTPHSR